MNWTEMELQETLQRNPALGVQGSGWGNTIVPIAEKLKKQKKSGKDINARTKYNNKKTELSGIKFDSQKEAARYQDLLFLYQHGEITGLKLQETFILQRAYTTFNGTRLRAITYTADFTYYEPSIHSWIIEDVKGRRTERFNLVWKMMQERYPEFVYRIT